MDWGSITFGDVLTVAILGVTGLVAYFGWQRAVERKFGDLEASVERKMNALDRSFDGKFTALAIQINTIMMRDVANLFSRVTAIELDNTNAHKQINMIMEDLNGVGLKVDRLERPTG